MNEQELKTRLQQADLTIKDLAMKIAQLEVNNPQLKSVIDLAQQEKQAEAADVAEG